MLRLRPTGAGDVAQLMAMEAGWGGRLRLVRHPGQMEVTLCVLLWARPGTEDGLIAYEDQVLKLVAGHGGRVRQRARSGGADGQPLEIQFLEFPSAAALDAYLTDDRRTALATERNRVIARTEVIPVQLVPGPASAG